MTTQSAPTERYAGLHSVFRALYRVPGARSLARSAARLVIQHSPLALRNRQRVYNFFSRETSESVRVRTHVRVPGNGTVAVNLDLDEDMDRNWYFWGYGGYERGLPELFQRLAAKRRYRTVIEVGANIGYFTLLMADSLRRNEPVGRVHAFEPYAPVFDQLEKNATLNQHLPISVYQSAMTDRDGTVSLFVPADEHARTNASLVAGLFPQKGANVVSAMQLDTFVASSGLERIDFLKMDCEGAEPAVLRGAQRTLADFRPDILCEVLPSTEQELDRHFSDLGYYKYLITETGPVRVEHLVANPTHRDYFLTTTVLDSTDR